LAHLANPFPTLFRDDWPPLGVEEALFEKTGKHHRKSPEALILPETHSRFDQFEARRLKNGV
jgi:hypothetical protein